MDQIASSWAEIHDGACKVWARAWAAVLAWTVLASTVLASTVLARTVLASTVLARTVPADIYGNVPGPMMARLSPVRPTSRPFPRG